MHLDAIDKTRAALNADPNLGKKQVKIEGLWNSRDGRFHITLPFPKGRTTPLILAPAEEEGCMDGSARNLSIDQVCMWGFSGCISWAMKLELEELKVCAVERTNR